MDAYDVAVFYRNAATSFVLAVGVSRTAAAGYKTSEGWYPASGQFALPMAAGGRAAAMTVARVAWAAEKASSNAVLLAAVNAALTAAGYTRPNGAAIV